MRIGDLLRTEKTLGHTDLMAIIGHALCLSKERVLMDPERKLVTEEREKVMGLIAQRAQGKPLAYIVGEREFYSEPFVVDPRVLIPRPETELAVARALSILKKKSGQASVLDMGTGSGIIGILLAKETQARIFSVDIAQGALDVARQNARSHGVNERVHLLCSDLFSAFKEGDVFDLIVANLPYIPASQWESLMEDVRNFEPRCALEGGKRGMEVYERFLAVAPSFLKRDGFMLCEIGGKEQAEEMARLLSAVGLKTSIKKDLSGRERLVEAAWIRLS